jgi:hypothetical protein
MMPKATDLISMAGGSFHRPFFLFWFFFFLVEKGFCGKSERAGVEGGESD